MKIETQVKFTRVVVKVYPMGKCEKCSEEFDCKNDDGCWCFELPKVLKINSDKCLCKKCLTKVIEDEKNKI